jgi:hypothetical protein
MRKLFWFKRGENYYLAIFWNRWQPVFRWRYRRS